jgi:hypothetical protein
VLELILMRLVGEPLQGSKFIDLPGFDAGEDLRQ